MAATWGTGISLKGAPGKDGLSVLAGYGPPAQNLGENGQAYIDVDAWDGYLRTDGAWAKTRTLVGPMGLNGLNSQLLHGDGPPDERTFGNNSDAIYFEASNAVWYFDFEGDKTWRNSGQTIRGMQGVAGRDGAAGKDGLRGSQNYVGSGPPSDDLNSFSPPAAPGDAYWDRTTPGGPYLYFLGT